MIERETYIRLVKSVGMLSVAAFSLIGCAQPKPATPDPNADAALKSETSNSREEELHFQIQALRRKGEVLDKIHHYQPFIRVLNVYIPGKQADSGEYTHPRTVSVPLIMKDKSIKQSDEAINSLFSDAATDDKTASDSKEQAQLTPKTATPGLNGTAQPADASTVRNAPLGSSAVPSPAATLRGSQGLRSGGSTALPNGATNSNAVYVQPSSNSSTTRQTTYDPKTGLMYYSN